MYRTKPKQENIVLDISENIKAAKLGRLRKDAQEDTCTVFAAALYDVLRSHGIPCQMVSAHNVQGDAWAHSLVEVDGRFYDSMGEFSTEIYRIRAKVHPSVSVEITYSPDFRCDCYDSEFEELYTFYVKQLKRAICVPVLATND